MVEYLPFPDIEAVCGKALRAAGVCDGRVYSSIPANPVYPLARVIRLGGLPVEKHRIDQPRIQVDVWGTNKSEARDAAEAARLTLHQLEGTTDSEFAAFISCVELDQGPTPFPDPDTGRDRYMLTVRITATTA